MLQHIKYPDSLLMQYFAVKPEQIEYNNRKGTTSVTINLPLGGHLNSELVLEFDAFGAMAVIQTEYDGMSSSSKPVRLCVAHVYTPHALKQEEPDDRKAIQLVNISALQQQLCRLGSFFGTVGTKPFYPEVDINYDDVEFFTQAASDNGGKCHEVPLPVNLAEFSAQERIDQIIQ